MSPILVRPVREQLEHDRVIRALQTRLKRKFDVAANVGDEHLAPVRLGKGPVFPDLVLSSQDRHRRLQVVVEVETGESVNNLEAMAEWASFARLPAAFHLYVPVASVEPARRLCADHQVAVSELWTYHAVGDQLRFTLVERSQPPRASTSSRARAARPARPRSTTKRRTPARKSARAKKDARRAAKPARAKRR